MDDNHINDTDIQQILKNFEKPENNEFYDEELMLQIALENSRENNNNNNNIEEDFLDKKIEEIKNIKIKEDLNQLISEFPSIDEYYIKSTYCSCENDYQNTFKYLKSKDKTQNLAMKNFMNSLGSNKNEIKNNNKSKKNININNQNKKYYSTLKNILENKPSNWNFQKENKNININDYITIRNRLYREAKNCFSVKNFKTGQLLMNKAKRYSQEIEQIAKNQGLNKFFENNKYYSKNSKEIDLHGLTVSQSKEIINKKIEILRKKKYEDNLKYINLTIITGTGSHSYGGKSVLYPELLPWLNNKNKLKVDGRLNEGIIYVTIY